MARRTWGLGIAAALAVGLAACGDGGGGDDDDGAPAPDAGLEADAAPPGPDMGPDLDGAPTPDAATDADATRPDVATSDARVPIRPDELPLEGPEDLPGPPDLASPVPAGRARAGRIDDEGERLRGPEAYCRVGDLRLDNAVISVCIEAESATGQLTSSGGSIIDAHRADRPGTDRLAQITVAPGFGEVTVERVGVVRDGGDGGPAVVRVVGHASGMQFVQSYLPGGLVPFPAKVTTEYRLAPDSDTVEVLSWLEADGERGGSIYLADLVYLGDQLRGIVPGSPEGPPPAGSFPFIGGEGPQVSYAWLDGRGAIDLFNIPISDAPFAMARQDNIRLEPGDVALVRRALRVGTGDAESLRRPGEAARPVAVSGPPGARVDVRDGAGLAATTVVLDGEGRGTVRLEAGAYRAQVVGWAGGVAPPAEFAVGEGEAEVTVTAPAPARVRWHVRDPQDRPLGARLRLTGPDEITVFVVGDAEALVPAGEWIATTTRGWHFTADERPLSLEAGGEAEATITLEEVIATPGWASGEFHQHAGPSLDSTVTVEDRVLGNVAEGVSFMTPSDHEMLYDYKGLVQRMGLSDRIGVPITGQEISPRITHIGAYGMPIDPYAGANGALPLAGKVDGRWKAFTVPELVAEARRRGAKVIQMNHPRADAGFFEHTGYTADRDVATLDPTRFTRDFNTVEVFNEKHFACQVMRDWLGLLNQGLRVTGVGNSDTHSVSQVPGYPRNYLPTAAQDATRITEEEVATALRNGAVTVGGGAFLDLPDGPLPGAEVRVEGGVLRVRVRVQTPPYTRVNRLIAFHNGRAVIDRTWDRPATDLVDFDETIDVPIDGDGPLVFYAEGDGGVRFVRPSQPTFAFANPLWADVDGGGVTAVGPGPIALPDGLELCR